MPELSVIIPFVNEWPLIAATIRSIGEAMEGSGIDFEVVAVDNWMPEVGDQLHPELGYRFGKDLGHTQLPRLAEAISWLRVTEYKEKLSTLNARNFGARRASADILLFMDAHCIVPHGVLPEMFRFYTREWRALNGSLHLPLTGQILAEQRLIYRMRWRAERADLDYTLAPARPLPEHAKHYEVPCMSSCGLMVHRSYLDRLGWWPSQLGIYGGGEHWLNYTMAIMGMRKWIYGDRPLYHHGGMRGYRWNAVDYERNRLIAIYLWGDVEMMTAFVEKRDFPRKRMLRQQIRLIVNDRELGHHKRLIEAGKVGEIEDFIADWTQRMRDERWWDGGGDAVEPGGGAL